MLPLYHESTFSNMHQWDYDLLHEGIAPYSPFVVSLNYSNFQGSLYKCIFWSSILLGVFVEQLGFDFNNIT